MGEPTIDVLAERVGHLERENRLWRWGGGACLIAGLVVVIGGAQRANEPRVIEAERLVVRDQHGKERIRLGLSSDGVPALFLWAKDGKDRVILQGGDEDGGSLNLF